jgi:hypothetical protein
MAMLNSLRFQPEDFSRVTDGHDETAANHAKQITTKAPVEQHPPFVGWG